MIFHVICPSLCRFMQLIKKLNIDYVSSELRILCENEIYRKQTSGSSVSGGTPWYARNSLCLCKAWLARVFCKRLGLIFGEIWVLKLVFEVVQKCDIGLNREIMKYRIINIERIANAVPVTLFKGHNIIVNIVVSNCQKCNQCLRCQVSGHKKLSKNLRTFKTLP